MIPYVVLILLILFFRAAIGPNRICRDKKRLFLILALIPAFVLMAFRGETVGSDTESYTRLFEDVKYGGVLGEADERLEVGYVWFSTVIADYLEDVQWLFAIAALFTCVSIGYFIYRNAKDPALALLFFITLGFFQFALSGLRQTLAISITLWLYPFIRDKRLIPFLIGVFIASLFHKSALLFLPAYFMAQQPITKGRILLEMLGFAVVFFIADKILLLAADIMEYEYGIEQTDSGYVFFVIVAAITVAGILKRSDILKQNPDNKNLLNLNFISFALWGVRLISRTAERVTLYYMPYTYVLLEEYVTSLNNKVYRILIYWVIALICIFLFLYRVSRDETLYYLFA